MIVYDLKCSNNHCFEGWFDDLRSFDSQRENGLISCPLCNDTLIHRIPSTFGIRSCRPSNEEKGSTSVELEPFVKKMAQFVRDHFDDVGCDFAKEALKIHYGAAEPRNIRGTSSSEEEQTLEREGVRFLKIPMPPESDTDSEP